MKEYDRIADEIRPNFYGGIHQSHLNEVIDFDQAGFYTRENLRAKTLQNQQNRLNNDDYQRLKLDLAQEGLDAHRHQQTLGKTPGGVKSGKSKEIRQICPDFFGRACHLDLPVHHPGHPGSGGAQLYSVDLHFASQ